MKFSDYMKKYQLEDRNPYAVEINDKIKIYDYVRTRIGAAETSELFAHRLYAGYDIKKCMAAIEKPCVVRLNNAWHKMKILLTCDDTITAAELAAWQAIKWVSSEWAYKQIRPGFTVERILPLRHNLFKLFVFRGRVHYVWQQVYTARPV